LTGITQQVKIPGNGILTLLGGSLHTCAIADAVHAFAASVSQCPLNVFCKQLFLTFLDAIKHLSALNVPLEYVLCLPLVASEQWDIILAIAFSKKNLRLCMLRVPVICYTPTVTQSVVAT
jgi:hypothetical protein